MENNAQKFRQQLITLLIGRVPQVYQERYKKEMIKTNISRMLGLSVYLIAIQILLNIINILKPADTKDTTINLYVGLSMVVLAVGIIFLIISILCKKNIIKHEGLCRTLPVLLIYLYGILQMVFFSLNVRAGTGGVNSYVIAIILMSFSVIIRPLHNIVNILACMTYAFLMMYSLREKSDMWNSVMITDTWANLVIITVLILFMSTLTYDMHRSDFINRIKLEEAAAKAKYLARVDTLTGILNRRGFFELLEERWPEFKAAGWPVAAAMFDIDYFKNYNDYYGHLAGDNCLFTISGVLREAFEEHDGILCRFGGEEFVAFFIPQSREHAAQMVENVRCRVERLKISGALGNPGNPYVTISAGFAVGQAPSDSHDELIHYADIALYESKRNGRNTVSEYHAPLNPEKRHVRIRRDDGEAYQGIEKRKKNT